jgi:hypothetical protein
MVDRMEIHSIAGSPGIKIIVPRIIFDEPVCLAQDGVYALLEFRDEAVLSSDEPSEDLAMVGGSW